ncbi:MAG: hypothetical protein D6687_09015 [Acidobacteria bacterium]|jgi:hypothetical protein|nr:MAG: hypothetical protein D6687_09015 [Acidobacteriota bacterium]GIU82277.1 MAG: hypothetical protein KatS3mg006_1341 [Pyrinomonadaceae bacterium]
METLNLASLINLLGFALGVILYSLLFFMVVYYREKPKVSSLNFFLLATACLGILWNLGELANTVWKSFFELTVSSFVNAISYSALAFLLAVTVHSSLKDSHKKRFLILIGYALSSTVTLLNFYSFAESNQAPSSLALQILTYGSLGIILALLALDFRQTIQRKALLILALGILVISAFHLSGDIEEKSWLVELLAHQASLPFAFVILLQDYRFAFADIFLKRALSLVLLTLTASSLYVFVVIPLMNDKGKLQSTAVVLSLWIATAIFYPFLRKKAIWIVDLLLRRPDYEKLRVELSKKIEQQESVEKILALLCEELSKTFTAAKTLWVETLDKEIGISISPQSVKILIPTADEPFYLITLEDFLGGRRLLSEEKDFLEKVALMTARRIDALRVSHERCEQELREQEFSKLATEAKLSALRAQINPHFLFNALTTIGYLIQASPDKALSTLMRLTQLLRAVLRSEEEFTPLSQELKLIESYLEIEKARFEERLQVSIQVPKKLEKIRIPSLILQPLVENAIKHGISKLKNGGKVEISAKIIKTDKGNFLQLTVFDEGGNFDKADLEKAMKKGIGLNNIRQRLKNYYGSLAQLEIFSEKGKGTEAKILLPLLEKNKSSVETKKFFGRINQ